MWTDVDALGSLHKWSQGQLLETVADANNFLNPRKSRSAVVSKVGYMF